MRWVTAAGITLIPIGLAVWGWKMFKKQDIKEMLAYSVITVFAWIIGVLLVYFPNMPGPTEFVGRLTKPISEWLG